MPTATQAKARVTFLLQEIRRVSKQGKVDSMATEALGQMGFITTAEQFQPGNPSISALAGDTIVTLTLSPAASSVPVTHFTLNRAPAADGPWTANLLSGSERVYVDTGRTNDVTYFYRTQAFNGVFGSPGFGTTSATPVGEISGHPEPNKIVQANGAGGAITTLQAMLTGLAANDKVEIRSNTPGTLWTCLESLTLSNKNFSLATMPEIWVRNGDSVLVKGNGSASPIFQVTNSSWVTWYGTDTPYEGIEWADPATWNPLSGFNGPHLITFRHWNSHHLFFRRGKLHGIGTGTKGNFLRRDSDTIVFEDYEIDRHGNPDDGDLLDIYASRVVLIRPKTKWGGHDCIGMQAPYCVIINPVLDGRWGDAHASYVGLGSRLFGMTGCAHDTWSPTKGGNQHVEGANGYTSDPATEFLFGPQLLHNAHVKNMFPSVIGNEEPASKKQSYRLIERGTLFTDLEDSCAWIGPTFGNNTGWAGDGNYTGPGQAECATYCITLYNVAGIWTNAGADWQSPLLSNDEMQLMSFNGILAGEVHDSESAGRSVIYWRTPSVPQDGWPNMWKGGVWDGVIVQGDAVRMNFELNLSMAAIGAAAEAAWPNNIKNVQEVGSIPWADVGTVGNRTRAGLTPTSGPAVGTRPPDARTTAIGVATITLPVTSVIPFADLENPATWNMGASSGVGLENDWIGVGATAAAAAGNLVQILSRNETTNVLTLKTPISFANGDGVWFAGNPSLGSPIQVWDNYGAGQ